MRYRSVVLVSVLVLLELSCTLAWAVKMTVDGEELRTSPPPVVRRGRVYVPAVAFRKIGLGVEVTGRDRASVGWPDSDAIIDFRAGRSYFTGEGPSPRRIALPGKPFMHRGALMVPLRSFLGQDLTGDWKAGSDTVRITRSPGWLDMRLSENDSFMHGRWYYLYETPIRGRFADTLPSQRLQRARSLLSRGRDSDAQAILLGLIQRRPFDWKPSDRSRSHYHREWEAYPLLGELLMKANPNHGEGYYYAGIWKAIAADYAGADTLFRRGSEVDPGNANLQYAVGWTLLRRQSGEGERSDTLGQALGYYRKALEIDPNHRTALVAAGYASEQIAWTVNRDEGYTEESKAKARQYLEASADYFERALKVQDTGKGLRELLREIYRQLGRS